MWPTVFYARRTETLSRTWQDKQHWAPDRVARQIVADIVSENISRLRQTLRLVDDPDRFGAERSARLKLQYSFTALIEVIYWHIARLAEQGDGVGVCQDEECGEFFHRTYQKQLYCPEPRDPKQADTRDGQQRGREQSRCMRRARARIARAKARTRSPN